MKMSANGSNFVKVNIVLFGKGLTHMVIIKPLLHSLHHGFQSQMLQNFEEKEKNMYNF